MTITEYAKLRNQSPQTVSRWINNHKDLFDGHIKTSGKTKELDEIAVRELDNQYPPRLVQVVEDVELQRKAENYLQKIMELQNELSQNKADMLLLYDKFLETEHNAALLEERTTRLQETEEELKKLQQEHKESEIELAIQHEKTRTLTDELDRLRNRNFFQRLFNMS